MDTTTVLLGLAIPLAISWYFYRRHRNRRFYELAEKLPGPPGYPLIGNALDFLGGAHSIFNKVLMNGKSFDNIMKIWIGPRMLVFLDHPEDIEIILSSNVHIDKSPEYTYLRPWLGNGLLISTGEKWKLHRKLIAPTFHLNVLKNFFPLFNLNSRLTVDRLRKLGNKEFDCHDFLSEATAEILMETVMGVTKKNSTNAFDYAMAVMKMCNILHIRQTSIFLYPEMIFSFTNYARLQKKLLNVIHNITKRVLKAKKESFEKDMEKLDESFLSAASKTKETKEANGNGIKEKSVDKSKENYSFGQSAGLKDDLDVDDDMGEKKRLPFLDMLIHSSQHGVLLSDEEIQNQVDTIMFEGHDTTAAGSSFFMCMMAAHPDIQDKIIEELDSIFGDSDRDVTFQDTLEMKYLERCIMETLRIYPPVPVIARELNEEVKLKSSKLTLPAHVTVVIATFKLHRREEIFDNPLEFNPDNFLPEKSASRHYYSYIPFSAGPRSCVGRKYAMLKLKVLLATILRNFKVVPGIPEKDWLLQGDIILKRTDGFNIKLEPRKKAANVY